MEFIRDGVQHIIFPFGLRDCQTQVLTNKGRFSMWVAPRQWGKTYALLVDLFLFLITIKKRNPRVMYVAPQKTQAKTNIWDEYVKPMAKMLPNCQISESDLEITFDLMDGLGVRKLLVRGADEGGMSLKGGYLDRVVVDEMREQQEKTVSEVLMPMLASRQGSMTLTGTVGQGYWSDMFHRAKNDPDSIWKTFTTLHIPGVTIPEGELESLEKAMASHDFAREYLCDWNSIDAGSVYSRTLLNLKEDGFMPKELEIGKNTPVVTAWDLGAADMTVVWFIQFMNGKYHVIDYLQVNQESADSVIGTQDNTESLDIRIFKYIMKKPYNYGVHILPHDSTHNNIDAVTSTLKKFQNLACGAKVIVAPKLLIKQGVEAVANILTDCRFSYDNTREGINAMHCYIPPFSSAYKRSNKWASHAPDAFRTFAVTLPHLQNTYSSYVGLIPKTKLPKKMVSRHSLIKKP